MLHLLFKKTSFLFQNDLSHCSASSIVFFSASAVTGVMRYLVLKSNGLRHSKNPPVKFSFSLKIVPATIAKKLPSQRWPQPLFIPLFNFSHKWPTFAFAGESGYTLGFRRKIAHNGSHGETRGVSGWGWYHYSRSVPHVLQHPRAGYQNGVLCRFWGLVGGAPKERRKPSGQRCAYARRCPEASRPRWAAWSFSLLSKLRFVHPALRAFCVCEARGGITTHARFARR